MAISDKIRHRILRKARIRARVRGTAERPRLSIYISQHAISAQVIDDDKGVTLATSQSKTTGGTLTERAALTGEDIAKKALKANIKRVVLDRNGRLYHGRIKVLADKARESGLEL